MIFKLYAIKDELSEFTPTLMPFEEDAHAKRWFRDYVAGNSMMRSNPEDFSLWAVGTFDTKLGKCEELAFTPELIERAKGATSNGNKENTAVQNPA